MQSLHVIHLGFPCLKSSNQVSMLPPSCSFNSSAFKLSTFGDVSGPLNYKCRLWHRHFHCGSVRPWKLSKQKRRLISGATKIKKSPSVKYERRIITLPRPTAIQDSFDTIMPCGSAALAKLLSRKLIIWMPLWPGNRVPNALRSLAKSIHLIFFKFSLIIYYRVCWSILSTCCMAVVGFESERLFDF